MAAPALPDGPYRVAVGDTTFDLTARGGTLRLGDTDADVRIEPVSGQQYVLFVGPNVHRLVVEGRDGDALTLWIDGQRVEASVKDERALLMERFGMQAGGSGASKEVKAPMPGLVLAVHVAAGDAVEPGQRLLVLEAMKMENEIKAAHAGTVAMVHAAPGAAVGKGALLVTFA